MSHIVLLSIGSNIGDRLEHIKSSLKSLRSFCTTVQTSAVYETEPVGKTDQSFFYNIAVKAETELSVTDFLRHCQEIETNLNRVKVVRWGPRTIDLDIIAYDQLILKTDELTVPHPEFHKRNFVLIPLAEIASEMRINGRSVGDYLENCTDDSIVKKLFSI